MSKSDNQILLNKIKTLIIPYLIWSSISFVSNLGLLYLHKNLSLNSAMEEFYCIFINSRSVWFLIQLFFAFFVFIVCKKIAKKLKLSAILVNIIAYVILCEILPLEIFSFVKFKWLYPFFLLGYIISMANKQNKLKISNRQ